MCKQLRSHAATGPGCPRSHRSSSGCRFGSRPPRVGGRRAARLLPAPQAAGERLSQAWSFPHCVLSSSHLAHVVQLQHGSALVFLQYFAGKPGHNVHLVRQLSAALSPAALASGFASCPEQECCSSEVVCCFFLLPLFPRRLWSPVKRLCSSS